MKLEFQSSPVFSVRADAHALMVYQGKGSLQKTEQRIAQHLGTAATEAIMRGDFQGKAGQVSLTYVHGDKRVHRLLLVGLGEEDKSTLESFRRASALAAKQARTLKAGNLAIEMPTLTGQAGDSLVATGEAAFLALYRFDKYQTKTRDDAPGEVKTVTLCSTQKSAKNAAASAIRYATVVAQGTMLARDLANAPGNEIYPETLAKATRASARRAGYRVTVLNEKRIAQLKMGGVIGVSRGSARAPRFLILEYGRKTKRPLVLVGKGVTFDTGGISIKPASGMAEMKMDMSGAAAVIGTFDAVARLRLPVHIIGLIPAVENMPGGSSFRPGDILRHLNGKTSEVDNTDAEGRLILADALAYAERYRPSAVIDLATLTGACVVALGHHASGMMGNDSDLMERLSTAGQNTYERVWQLPLFDEYDRLIRSDVADVKNIGGRWAGAITAAMFLKRFIGSYKWVHLDIAGTAMLEEQGEYTQRGASGVGVRLLTELLRRYR